MELVTLSSDTIKKSISEDGTLTIKIKEDYLLKISHGEIKSLDIIISGQQAEALGIAKKMIDKLEKSLDRIESAQLQPKNPTIINDDGIFNPEQKKRFINFLESYLSEDEETVEVFDSEEFKAVIGQEFLVSELEEEFGSDYAFKELDDNRISVALLSA